jgi:Sulfotransferase domain
MRRAARMAGDLTRQSVFGGKLEDRRRAIEAFVQWNEDVTERVPAEKLLVYEVKEGWGPLCDFLGVEAPVDEPFPHLNDADSFRQMIRRRMVVAVAILVGLALLYLLSETAFRRP